MKPKALSTRGRYTKKPKKTHPGTTRPMTQQPLGVGTKKRRVREEMAKASRKINRRNSKRWKKKREK